MNWLQLNRIFHGVSMLGIALLSACSGALGGDSTSGDDWSATDDGKLSLEFENLSDGDEVTGTQTVGFAIGGGSGDRQIAVSVEGAEQETLDGEPWEWAWDTTGLEFGEYTLAATAEDGSGATVSAEVTVYAGAKGKWTRLVGGSDRDEGRGVAVDSGNVYVAGITKSEFGGQTPGGLSRDVFVAKYDRLGARKWVRFLGNSSQDEVADITTDGAGNIYIGGSTDKGLAGQAYGGGFLDGFLAKFNAAGDRKWVRMVGSSGSDSVSSLTADGSGHLYVVGDTDEGIGESAYSGGAWDGYVAKFDQTGSRRWMRPIGSSGTDVPLGIATDGGGEIYVSGLTNDTLGGRTYGGGRTDGFLAKYAPSGDRSWIRLIGGEDSDIAISVAAASDEVYVTGSGLREDGYVARYDETGERNWLRPIGLTTTEDDDGARSVSTDGAGRLYVAGDTAEGFGGQNYNGRKSDGFVAWFDRSGERNGVKLIGTNSNDSAWDVAAAGPGVIYATGCTTDNGESLAGRPYNGGTFDGFLVKRSW